MSQRRVSVVGVLLAVFLFFPSWAAAQGGTSYSVVLSAVIGGTGDADPDPDIDNLGFQATFTMKTERRSWFTVRAGQMDLEVDEFGGAFDATLRYLSVGGEYRIPAAFYESGLFVAIGGYDVDGGLFVESETSFGISLGTTGDFRLSDRISLVVELAGHLTDLDYANVFVTGSAGIAFHF